MFLLLCLIHDTLLLLHLDLLLGFLLFPLILHLFVIHQALVLELILIIAGGFLLSVGGDVSIRSSLTVTHLECLIGFEVLLVVLLAFFVDLVLLGQLFDLQLRLLSVDALDVLDSLLSFFLELDQTEWCAALSFLELDITIAISCG